MSATVLLDRLYKSLNAAYYGGALPADAVVEDVRIPPGVLGPIAGTWNDKTHRLRVDMPGSRQWRGPVFVFTHEVAHAATPQLSLADCHNAVFQREHDRLLGLVLNGIKKRELRGGTTTGVQRPPATKLRALPPALTIGPARDFGGPGHRPSRKETFMLHPYHADRHEIAGPNGETGRDMLRRIQAFERELEARIPGAARWIAAYAPFFDARGHWQPGVTLRDHLGPMTVREARAITAQRMKNERSPR